MPSDTEAGGTYREPTIYDVVELPEFQKGADCPMTIGESPQRCGKPVEFVYVCDATVEGDGRRVNCRCCAECKPAVTTGGVELSVSEEEAYRAANLAMGVEDAEEADRNV